MTVVKTEDLPADTVDVSEEVNELKAQLRDIFTGQEVVVVAMAVGSVIGETFDDEEIVKNVLFNINHMAATVFAIAQLPPEEGTVH